ncbi:Snf7 family [Pholiota molesta]|nr:Snf7 family [Pholiota molesta]
MFSIPEETSLFSLKLQRDKLKQYQKKVQAILDREHAIAKAQIAAGQKDRALIALRRRKYQQTLLTKTDQQLENLEQLVSTIEFSLVEVSVLHGLKQGNESVEKLLEETAEAREYQKEIGDLLSNTLTLDDEDAVQNELLALQQDIEREAADIILPSVPEEQPLREESATVAETRPIVAEGRQKVAVPG